MRPACLKLAFNYRNIAEVLNYLVMSHSMFPLVTVRNTYIIFLSLGFLPTSRYGALRRIGVPHTVQYISVGCTVENCFAAFWAYSFFR